MDHQASKKLKNKSYVIRSNFHANFLIVRLFTEHVGKSVIEFTFQIFISIVTLRGQLYIQSTLYFDICVVNCFILSFTSCSAGKTTELYSPSQAAYGWWIRKQIHE